MPYYLFFELAAVITGLFIFQKLNSPVFMYRQILLLAIISFVVDLAGTYSYVLFEIQNGWLYNLYDIYKYCAIPYILLSFIYLRPGYRHKIYTLVFLGAFLIDLFKIKSANDYLPYTTLSGDTMIVICCLLFYKKLLMAPIYTSIIKLPEFWFVSGIFLYFLSMLPFHFLWNLVTSNMLVATTQLAYKIIVTISIAFLYLGISYYFILCNYQKRK